MYKIFNTIEEFNAKNAELNDLLGYPNENESTTTYAEPIITVDNKYAMQVLDYVKEQFTDLIETIDTKEYLQD